MLIARFFSNQCIALDPGVAGVYNLQEETFNLVLGLLTNPKQRLLVPYSTPHEHQRNHRINVSLPPG